MNKRNKAVLATLISSLALSASAGAADVYPGAACVLQSGGALTINYGSLENRSTTSSIVACPVPHNDYNKPMVDAEIRVRDPHETEDVECELRVVTLISNGGFGYSSNYKETSGFSSEWQPLNFDIVGDGNEEHLYMRCVLPPKNGTEYSKIGNYELIE